MEFALSKWPHLHRAYLLASLLDCQKALYVPRSHFGFLSIPAHLSQNVTCKSYWYVLKVKNMQGQPQIPGVRGKFGAAKGDQLQTSRNQKILLIKVVRYDNLMIKITPDVWVDLMCGLRRATSRAGQSRVMYNKSLNLNQVFDSPERFKGLTKNCRARRSWAT